MNNDIRAILGIRQADLVFTSYSECPSDAGIRIHGSGHRNRSRQIIP